MVLVHIENTFRHLFPAGFIKNIHRYVKLGNFDQVIHFTSYINDECPINEISCLIDREIEWAWGYEPEMFNKKERKWLIQSSGHEYTWIPPIFRNKNEWRKTHIYLGGGYESECLADMKSILDKQRIKYLKCHRIIY